MDTPRIVIIAGPNGAGKTTFAREFLPNEAGCPTFVNADLIAAGLSPFAPELAALKAGRLMLDAIAEHASKRESFAFETTHDSALATCGIFRRAGLSFASGRRDGSRTRRGTRGPGGHDVLEAVVRRRFAAGLANFHARYKPLVDRWFFYDNSTSPPELLEAGNQS